MGRKGQYNYAEFDNTGTSGPLLLKIIIVAVLYYTVYSPAGRSGPPSESRNSDRGVQGSQLLIRQPATIPERLTSHLQQVALEAMVSSTGLVTTKTASKLWLTPQLQVELRLGAEGISHKEAAVMWLSHWLASKGVQISNKAGITGYTSRESDLVAEMLVELPYSNSKFHVYIHYAFVNQLSYQAVYAVISQRPSFSWSTYLCLLGWAHVEFPAICTCAGELPI